MTNQQHPISTPLELKQRLYGLPQMKAIEMAFRAGADAELEACCEWMDYNCPSVGVHHLRAARRPKPQSLKEQGIESLDAVIECLKALVPGASVDGEHINTIRRALEQLPDQTIEGD